MPAVGVRIEAEILFVPHHSFGDEINRAICQSEIEGGVALDSLPVGTVLNVQTAYSRYRMEYRGDGEVLISGHPELCPEPVLVHFHGSTWGTPMIRRRYIARGMHMEIGYPGCGVAITSRVREIQEEPARPPENQESETAGPGASARKAQNEQSPGEKQQRTGLGDGRLDLHIPGDGIEA